MKKLILNKKQHRGVGQIVKFVAVKPHNSSTSMDCSLNILTKSSRLGPVAVVFRLNVSLLGSEWGPPKGGGGS